MAAFKKGDRVRHPAKEDWGLGQVLEDSTEAMVRIFFVGAGERKLSLNLVTPVVVTGDEAQDVRLDNLKVARMDDGAVRYHSVPRVIDRFLEIYPGGFYGDHYLSVERNYKVKAHELAVALLSRDELAELIQQEAYEEICRRARRVTNATNLIFPNEKMAFKDGLATPVAQKQFALALNALLHGAAPFEERFVAFCAVLEEIGAAKWTIATYFPFLVAPQAHMFIKPMPTQKAAELSAFEINYRPQLNWLTYRNVLAFAEHLREAIAPLKPRDMIDVQSFLWCIAPEI
jgi:hypothetical protein